MDMFEGKFTFIVAPSRTVTIILVDLTWANVEVKTMYEDNPDHVPTVGNKSKHYKHNKTEH